MQPRFTNLIQVLDHWAEIRPQALAFSFLEDGELEEQQITFLELQRRAWGVARHLGVGAARQPVLVMCEPGLDFITAFLGVLAAGGIAVPVSPPSRSAGLATLRRIAQDSGATRVLTTSALLGRLTRTFDSKLLAEAMGFATAVDELAEADTPSATLGYARSHEIALIQYTSGSTSQPKGVVLTQEHLLSNQAAIRRAFGHDTVSTLVVGWLPQFHDMGLIGNVLQPLFLGRPSVLMSPLHFLQRPARWLHAISRHRATTSGAPNFAYDVCVDRIDDKALEGLDLSGWRVAFNGAEPIRAKTMRRFAERFAPVGFDAKAFFPCYGMAEATLFVTGMVRGAPPVSDHFARTALEQGRAEVALPSDETTELVCLGAPDIGTDIRIVDPVTCCACAPGTVGEIWIHGPSVGLGYHAAPEATARTFNARLSGTDDERSYLRTGDFGFIRDDMLYFATRAKDLIIVRGKNHYPQDLECSVRESLGQAKCGATAAFIDESCAQARLVVVQEIWAKSLAADESRRLKGLAVEAVTRAHQLRLETVVLVARGSIPQTSSGKVKRTACRELFQKGLLHEL